MGITFDQYIFKNPLGPKGTVTITVQSNIRKKLAAAFESQYYKSLDDGKLYIIEDLPIDIYFPKGSQETKDYEYWADKCDKAEILHAMMVKFVEGQHSQEPPAQTVTKAPKQHGDVKVYCGHYPEVTKVTVTVDPQMGPNPTHMDVEMFQEDSLTPTIYNTIARYSTTTLRTPGEIYSKTILTNSRYYKPTKEDFTRKNVNNVTLCKLLPTSDPANDSAAVGYKTHAWDTMHGLIPEHHVRPLL